MNLDDTNLVRPEDARPAGRPDECFYCREPMGQPHKADCVVVSRTVVVKVELEVVISVPRNWTAENIEFARNEGSWCSDNMLRHLGRWADREGEQRICSCGTMHVSFEREATQEDHETRPVLP